MKEYALMCEKAKRLQKQAKESLEEDYYIEWWDKKTDNFVKTILTLEDIKIIQYEDDYIVFFSTDQLLDWGIEHFLNLNDCNFFHCLKLVSVDIMYNSRRELLLKIVMFLQVESKFWGPVSKDWVSEETFIHEVKRT